jgi:hypothetical protein
VCKQEIVEYRDDYRYRNATVAETELQTIDYGPSD